MQAFNLVVLLIIHKKLMKHKQKFYSISILKKHGLCGKSIQATTTEKQQPLDSNQMRYPMST